MRRWPGWRVAATLALGFAVLLLPLALRGSWTPRFALWPVVRLCAAMQDRFGTPFPCLRVVPDSRDTPGYAVLRAPGNTTHVIVTPIVAISGIENDAVLKPDAAIYWRAAFAARRDVEIGAKGRVAASGIGLAINSRRTRSQDQLHIHAECIGPDLQAAVRSQAFKEGADWQLLERPADDEHLLARLLARQDVESGDLFRLLATIPPVPSSTSGGIGDVAAFVVPASADGAPDRFVVVASRTRRRSIERLLDDSCSLALGG